MAAASVQLCYLNRFPLLSSQLLKQSPVAALKTIARKEEDSSIEVRSAIEVWCLRKQALRS